ncbi:aminopeptidase [Sutcliffiella horikoshii]|uniref:aminopeptidase n=1 Tax=Bacillaceae TaxID=186817 RepID=UPI0001E89A48|nr:aminopeptidase [Bacillus sp. m3-13]
MSNLQTTMEKYAELAVKVGVNIQKGQTLIVNADIATAPFVRLVTKKAYEAGAKLVQIEWSDEQVTRIRYDKAPDESFEYFPGWRAEMLEKAFGEGAAMLAITSVNPDLLKGVDASKIANLQKAAGEATKAYRNMVMADKISWSIVAVPSKGWSAKVFPELSEQEQEEKLWEAIFHATRANLEDPVQAWMDHKEKLSEKVDFLNNKKFKSLHYKAEGTDLTIELAEKHVWIGPESINENGVAFIANMPTEEVFTTPLKTGVNGTVRSSKPLNYGGNMIDNFSITFENGKIVSFEAEEGNETLQKLIETDEGSQYLGEVALVPHDSPISNTNLIFYNTLFDENASHHLAIGNAYSFALEGGKQMSEEDLEAAGANSSITHVDFMIGSSDMDIDGITHDGERVPLFRQGNWA